MATQFVYSIDLENKCRKFFILILVSYALKHFDEKVKTFDRLVV